MIRWTSHIKLEKSEEIIEVYLDFQNGNCDKLLKSLQWIEECNNLRYLEIENLSVNTPKFSISKLLESKISLSGKTVRKEILKDKILTEECKNQLIDFIKDKTVYSMLSVTFEDIFVRI